MGVLSRFWPRLMVQDHIISNLEEYSKSNMLQDTKFQSTPLQEHIANLLLEHCAFQIWSWSIFDLENTSCDYKWSRTISRGQSKKPHEPPNLQYIHGTGGGGT